MIEPWNTLPACTLELVALPSRNPGCTFENDQTCNSELDNSHNECVKSKKKFSVILFAALVNNSAQTSTDRSEAVFAVAKL